MSTQCKGYKIYYACWLQNYAVAMHHVASSVIIAKGVFFKIVENYHRSSYYNVENVKDYSSTHGCFIQLQGSI